VYRLLSRETPGTPTGQITKEQLDKAAEALEKKSPHLCEGLDNPTHRRKIYGAAMTNNRDRKNLLDTAQKLLEKGLGIQEALYGTENYKLAPTLTHLASTYFTMSKHEASRQAAQRALAIQARHFGDQNHPESALALTFLAKASYALGEHTKAQEIKKRVLHILTEHPLYGPKHMLMEECAQLLKDIGAPEEKAKKKGPFQHGSEGISSSFFRKEKDAPTSAASLPHTPRPG